MEKLLDQDFPVTLWEREIDLATTDAVSLETSREDNESGLWSIRFYNLSSEGTDLSINTCYENDWWLVLCNRRALGIEFTGSNSMNQR